MIIDIVIALVIFKIISFFYLGAVDSVRRYLRKINRKIKSKAIAWLLK